MPSDSDNSKYTAFRCPAELLELARYRARKDRRSLSNYIIMLIERDVKDMLPPDHEEPPPVFRRTKQEPQ